MKMIAIDIETTGLEPDSSHVLEICAKVFEGDTILDSAKWLIKRTTCYGNAYALRMNAELLVEAFEKGLDIDYVRPAFKEWYAKYKGLTIIGKNAGSFDVPFLSHHGFLKKADYKYVIDVGSLYFKPSMEKVPNLQACMKIAGLEFKTNHRAEQDVDAVIALYNYWHNNYDILHKPN